MKKRILLAALGGALVGAGLAEAFHWFNVLDSLNDFSENFPEDAIFSYTNEKALYTGLEILNVEKVQNASLRVAGEVAVGGYMLGSAFGARK